MVTLAELLLRDIGPDLPVLSGTNKADSPLVISETRDYVAIEYAVVRHVIRSIGEEWQLAEQRLRHRDGCVIDELAVNVKDPWRQSGGAVDGSTSTSHAAGRRHIATRHDFSFHRIRTSAAMYRVLMLTTISCFVAPADAAHPHEPEQAPAHTRPAPANPSSTGPSSQEKKPDLSDLEESIRRIRSRDGTGGGPATRYPGRMPKVKQSDRNSFHPPTNHGKADPPIPADTRTRQE